MITKIFNYYIGDKAVVSGNVNTKPTVARDSNSLMMIEFSILDSNYNEQNCILYIDENGLLLLDESGKALLKFSI